MMFRSIRGLFSSSHDGDGSTSHWINQRLTSIFLIPLSVLFVFEGKEHYLKNYRNYMLAFCNGGYIFLRQYI